MMKKRKLFLFLIVIAFTTGVSFYISVNKSSAVLPFGGPITGTLYCTCSANMLISVGPPVSGIFIYQDGGTILDLYGRVWSPGADALGLFSPGNACLLYVAVGCAPVPIPIEGTMIEVGTS